MPTTVARFCARHRRGVLAAWILLIMIGMAAAVPLFGHLSYAAGGSSESARGAAILSRASSTGQGALILVQGAPVDAAATRAEVLALTAKVARLPQVTGAVNAYSSREPGLRARDGRASLIVVSLRKGASTTDQATAVRAMRAESRGAVPGARVRVGGDAALTADMNSALHSDLFRGALISFPILLIALLFIFGGLRAALLPIIGALTTIAGALLVLLGIAYITDLSPLVLDVVLLFGLALAVDYGLLMVNRFREARVGLDIANAVEHTGATAGRTVTFSAFTVATALAGLFAFGDPIFTSVAISGIATVLVALAAALTLMPALLAGGGAKLKAAPRRRAEEGLFGRLARLVQRQPWLAVAGVGAVLVVAFLPFLHANYGNSDPRTLPLGSESRQVTLALAAQFPAMQADPITVVAQMPATDPQITAYAATLARQPGVAAVSIEHGLHGNVAAIDVTPAGTTQGAIAQHLVAALRENRPHFQTWITGSAASLMDFKSQITRRLPYSLALIALATLVLLFLMTGSVLIPVKAMVMNTLSLGAVFGALVWVFQDGHLSHLLGFQAFGAIEAWVPVVVFVFAFGLSMDYEVFLLSRIKETHDEGADTNRAVAAGLQRSGRIITSAAFLVLIVFLGFAAGHSLGVKEFGLALAIAVAVDATLVRCILVPATMTLLGQANWWAPAPLRRLHHHLGLHETPAHRAGSTSAPPVPETPVTAGRHR